MKQCISCGRNFRPYPQVTKQLYCSNHQCQRERKRLWQKEKIKNDLDYRDNQMRANRAWHHRNPNYWKAYRQRMGKRNQRRPKDAKMGSTAGFSPIPTGIYSLTPHFHHGAAKMDEWIVEIKFISRTYKSSARKERT